MKQALIMYCLFSALLISSLAFAGQVVSDPSQFPRAASEACEGRSVGVDCQIEFAGGYVSFGICVEVPNGGGELTCQIDTSEIPENCRNNAMGTKGSWITFGSLGAFLLFLRRRRNY